MPFIDEWQAKLDDSYAEFARLAAKTQDIDFNYGILSTAVLWPVHDTFDDDDAFDTLFDICGRKANVVYKAIRRWGDDPEEAARELSGKTKDNEKLREGLDTLTEHFDATSAFSEHLAPILAEQQDGGDVYNIAEQIKAALVNIGGVTNVQSLNNHIQSLAINITQATPAIQIPDPSRPVAVPDTPGFVGRKRELAYYNEKLADVHLAVISGLVGVGKTSLAATLAQQQPLNSDKIFWHEFKKGDGAASVIRKLAGFLAWHGHSRNVWEMVEQTRLNKSTPRPSDELFRFLFEQILGKGFMLCLDNFHFIDSDPTTEYLADELRPAIEKGELWLIIASQVMPELVKTTTFETLDGLSLADIKQLLDSNRIESSEALLDELYRWTEGNAQLLDMAINMIQKTDEEPAQIGARLAVARDVANFLEKNVDDNLSEKNRQIMIAVATLMDNPGTRDAIATVANQRMIRDNLHQLSEQHLLVEHKEQLIKYSEHATLQAYYYDMPETSILREMHRRAGEYYDNEEQERDWFLAARHYLEAQSYKQAAELIADDVRSLINQGQARPLRNVLERLLKEEKWLDPDTQVFVYMAHGEVCSFLSDMQPARESYQLALDLLAELSLLSPSLKIRERIAQVYLGLAKLVRYESPQETLDWLQKGLAEVAQVPIKQRRLVRQTEASLHITSGAVLYFMGEYETAVQSLQQGLLLLVKQLSQLRAIALKNLGNIYDDRGKVELAFQYWQEALDISQKIGDVFQVVSIRGNMGIGKEVAGHWSEASEYYQEALKTAEQLGSQREQMKLNNLLAILSTNQGADEAAHQYFTKALQLARDYKLDLSLPYILPSMATLHIRTQNWEAAKEALTEAEQMCEEVDTKCQFAEIYYIWAQIYLAKGNLQAALDRVKRSLVLTQELELDLEEGIALAILGQIYLAGDRPKEAIAAFEESLTLLADRDPYQAARAKALWGRYLTAGSDTEPGTILLKEARNVFQELGAKRDLAEVNEFLEIKQESQNGTDR